VIEAFSAQFSSLEKTFSNANISNLKDTNAPCLYVCEITKENNSHFGIVGAIDSQLLDSNITRHERVYPSRVKSLSVSMLDSGVQRTPVFLIHENVSVDVFIENHISNNAKILSVGFEDAVYNFWIIHEDYEIDMVTKLFLDTKSFFLADGHHRASVYKKHLPKEKIISTFFSKDNALVSPIHKLFLICEESSKKDVKLQLKQFFDFNTLRNELCLKENQTVLVFNDEAYILTLKGEFSLLLREKTLISEVVHDALFNVDFKSAASDDLVMRDEIRSVSGSINLSEFSSRVSLDNQVGFFFPEFSLDNALGLKHYLYPNTTCFEPKMPEGLINFPIEYGSK